MEACAWRRALSCGAACVALFPSHLALPHSSSVLVLLVNAIVRTAGEREAMRGRGAFVASGERRVVESAARDDASMFVRVEFVVEDRNVVFFVACRPFGSRK